jgi:hypothetical protein
MLWVNPFTDFRRDRSVRLEHFGPEVEQGDHGELPRLGQQPVDFHEVIATWMVGHSLALENRHENDPALRSLGAQPPKDGAHALGDSGGWVLSGLLGIARVVGADVEHNDPGMQPIKFAVVQAPKHVLDAVPAKTEIQRPVRAESGLSTGGAIGLRRLGIAAPEVGDRVTDEYDFGIEPGFDGEKRWPLSSGNFASVGDSQ